MTKDGCAQCGAVLAHPERGRRRRYCSRSCQARGYRARRDAPPPRPPRPARLTTVRIVRTAVALADRAGPAPIVVRELAAELGITAAALRRRIGNRDALLAAMAELVLAEAVLPAPGGRRERLWHIAHEEWRLYRAHPWLLPVLAQVRPPLGPGLFDLVDPALSALDELGAQALAAYLAVSGLVQGMALLTMNPAAGAGEPLHDAVDPVAHPAAYRLFTDAAAPDLDAVLDTALNLLLDGIETRVSPASAPR
ncbi:TetR/AcrR family transcriptional regulator C-terminal domain-containing protein [Nocardia sp. NPDC057227]|uniref:TetR/AcrR family transcriptional regulator C-terminal domain-containing protein n=1 Tax=Nocardia sp. NPDC057227 TaxID=3346056 RepID=UPI003634C2CD